MVQAGRYHPCWSCCPSAAPWGVLGRGGVQEALFPKETKSPWTPGKQTDPSDHGSEFSGHVPCSYVNVMRLLLELGAYGIWGLCVCCVCVYVSIMVYIYITIYICTHIFSHVNLYKNVCVWGCGYFQVRSFSIRSVSRICRIEGSRASGFQMVDFLGASSVTDLGGFVVDGVCI